MGTPLDNIDLTEITFVRNLRRVSSDFSDIFLVRIRDQKCVMKVHHGKRPQQDCELDFHLKESTAYRRLKERGLCDRGIVPNFLGEIRRFDPSLCQPDLHWQPFLKHYMDDEYPPSAIFLEYIPNLEKIHPVENFTQQRMDNLVNGIRQINKALILHNDLYPRNMMIIKDTPESKSDRVIWLDFDRAETFNEDEITDEQARLIAMEEKIVSDLGSSLAIDHEKGELDDAYMFYC